MTTEIKSYYEIVDEIILKRLKEYISNKYEEVVEFNLSEEYFIGVTVGVLNAYKLTCPYQSDYVIKEYNDYRMTLLNKMRGE